MNLTELLLRNCMAALFSLSLSDFQSSITRARFEDLCGDYFRATMGPVDKVLKVSGNLSPLTKDD